MSGERQRRVLVIDRIQADRRLAVDALQQAGYRTAAAAGAVDALRILDERGAPELIVAALDMGPISALDLAAVVRLRWPHLPVVIVGELETAQQTTRADAITHVYMAAPPVRPDTLRAATEQALIEAAAARTRPPAPNAVGSGRGAERVLVVDDEEVARRFLVRVLEDAGFDVVAVASFDQALDALVPELTLVVTDLDLHGRSGLELIAEISVRYPGLAVIAMSGDPSLLGAAADIGVDACFPKPFAADQLQSVARALSNIHRLSERGS